MSQILSIFKILSINILTFMSIYRQKYKIQLYYFKKYTVLVAVLYINTSFVVTQYGHNKWRPPSLSELTSMVFNTELIHLGSDPSKFDELF